MGSHTWVERCPYCDFDKVPVSSYDCIHFEVMCPICGYARWTEEKVPDNYGIELAKQTLDKMGDKEKQRALDQYEDDHIPLIARQKEK